MKIALLGTGKTGSKVLEIAGATDGHEVTEFNLANPPSVEKLKQHDAAISFLPGPAFLECIDMLIASGVPVATGSTGFDWPQDINDRLKASGLAWVTASNFSLGMNLVYGMLGVLSRAPLIYDDFEFQLHEIHHIHKKDKPSGTALSWQDSVGQKIDITSERVGETIGDHKLTLVTKYEDITVQHRGKDRRIYAQGALWAAQKLADGQIEPGLHTFQNIIKKDLSL